MLALRGSDEIARGVIARPSDSTVEPKPESIMTKTKIAPSPKKAPPATPAARAAEEIRRFHALGRRVLKRAEDDRIPKHKAAGLVSEEEGVSFDRARKAARFAVFSDRARESVCSLCLTGKAPLSVAHVRRVLGLKRRSDSLMWLKRAAESGWSADRLELALNQGAATEKGGTGGPRIKMPIDLPDALQQVIVQSDGWLKRYEAAWQQDEAWPPIIGIDNADFEVSSVRLRKAKALLRRLRDGATALEERLKKIDRRLRKKPDSVGE
jgi:hypothetical protein